MSVFKCKMCGGTLDVHDGDKVVKCPYCDSTQTISNSNDEQVLKAIEMGNHFRNNNDFDKAFNIFNQVILNGAEDAEIYWGILLCKYGITYVDDYDGTKKPTFNRLSKDMFVDDEYYKKVLELSDPLSREQYESEAKKINNIQKYILNIVSKEKPYDIFISYKETDENGDRTIDSVVAQEIYDELVKHDYRVFFSRVTLEGKLGLDYEPIIFSALHSAKVMLVVGTSADRFNSTWVKNEWARYITIMAKDNSKILIPCYKDMDAYDMPNEFLARQSQNLGKVGAIQDIVRGLDKIFDKTSTKHKIVNNEEIKKLLKNQTKETEIKQLNRISNELLQGNFSVINKIVQLVLDNNPDCKLANLYQLLNKANCSTILKFIDKYELNVDEETLIALKEYEPLTNYDKYNELADGIIKTFTLRINDLYNSCLELYNNHNIEEAIEEFKQISDFLNAEQEEKRVEILQQYSRLEEIYAKGMSLFVSADESVDKLKKDEKNSLKLEELHSNEVKLLYDIGCECFEYYKEMNLYNFNDINENYYEKLKKLVGDLKHSLLSITSKKNLHLEEWMLFFSINEQKSFTKEEVKNRIDKIIKQKNIILCVLFILLAIAIIILVVCLEVL